MTYGQSVPALISKNVGNTLTNYKTWGSIIFNVKDYGAKGDFNTTTKTGTDDTTAIVAAHAAAKAAGGGTIYFPPGVYRFGKSLTTIDGNNITITGSNATLYLQYTDDQPMLLIKGNNVIINGLTFDSDPTYARRFIASQIFTSGAQNVYIYGNTFKNSPCTALYADASSAHMVVTGNIVDSTKADGLHFVQGTHDVVCANNKLYNTGDDSISTGWASGYPLQTADILIQGNLIRGGAGHGIAIISCKRVSVIGNEIFDTLQGGIASYTDTNPAYTEELDIIGNTMHNAGTSASSSGILCDGVKNCVVSGNTIYTTNQSGILLGNYINLKIKANTIRNTGKHGIEQFNTSLKNTTQDLFIENNTIDTTVKDAIRLTHFAGGSSVGCNISGNRVYKSDTGSTSTTFLYVANASALRMIDNIAYDGTDIAAYDSATVTGVVIIGDNFPSSWIQYTPTAVSSTGAITTYSAVGYYEQRGNIVNIHVEVTVTTNGTGAGFIDISLPVSALRGIIAGRETALVGNALIGEASTTHLRVTKHDATYPAANGAVLKMTGSYAI